MTEILISEIKLLRDCYPRSAPWWAHSYELFQKMKAGAKFPPVVLTRFKGETVLVDGWHRIEAAKKFGSSKIEAEFIICKDKDSILIEAITRNITHGLKLSPHDLIRLAAILHKKGKSWNEIGSLLSWPSADLKRISGERVTKWEGPEPVVLKSVTVDSPVPISSETEQRMFTGKSQINILEQVVGLIKNGYLDISNPRILELIAELRELIVSFKPIKVKQA